MFQISEEQKLSLQIGELLHTIANELNDNGKVQILATDPHRSKMIMELSEVLRTSQPVNGDAPFLLAQGFNISDHPRSTWVELACDLMFGTTDVKALIDTYCRNSVSDTNKKFNGK